MAATISLSARETLLARIGRLRADSQPRWGRMTATQMVCHLGDQLRVALGELPARPIPGPLRHAPLKQLVIFVLPWPRGIVQTPPEFRTTPAEAWEPHIRALRALFTRFAAREVEGVWATHPYFGAMSGHAWAMVTRKHFHHHLTQFGV